MYAQMNIVISKCTIVTAGEDINVLLKLLENINGPLENMKSCMLFILTIQKMS